MTNKSQDALAGRSILSVHNVVLSMMILTRFVFGVIHTCLFLLLLLLFVERAKDADFVILVFVEVESIQVPVSKSNIRLG